jgi:regulator of protease activity HflC (stomatin/prohibitin superfamily)
MGQLDPKNGSEDDDYDYEKRTFRDVAGDWFSRLQFATYFVLVVSLLLIGFLWPRMFISIPPGHSGVVYVYFGGGTDTENIRREGLAVIAPWNKLTIYETRLQQQTLKFDVLSEEGLNLDVAVSVRFRPRTDMLGYLHKDIGEDYFERLVRPEVEAHVRRTFGSRPAHEIYASSRDVLQELGRIPILGRVDEDGGPEGKEAIPYVQIQELKLIDIELPAIVQGAIAERYRQEQLMLEYQYRLEREEKEAERKRTEAGGIRDFNLIAGRVSPDMLRWRGIDATVELAKSQNSKVVVVGGGAGGLPIIMNLGDDANPPAATQGPPLGTPPVASPENPPTSLPATQPPAGTPPVAPTP